jgi:hypothetical protein
MRFNPKDDLCFPNLFKNILKLNKINSKSRKNSNFKLFVHVMVQFMKLGMVSNEKMIIALKKPHT